MRAYRNYALFTLAACVGVIVLGAYVRASGSGAGCGAHWPLCNGVLLPETDRHQTLVELSHRLTSAVLLLGCGGLLFGAWRVFPARSFGRRAALLSGGAVVLEALIGALIVLVRLVEDDKSVERVISVPLHLVNTLFLLATLTCARLAAIQPGARWRWRDDQGKLRPLQLTLGFAALGGLGGVAALGDTLFPPTSVLAGVLRDFSGKSHLAEQIRVFHPLLALLWAGAAASWFAALWERRPRLRRHGQLTLTLTALNLVLGLGNILLLAPIWLQMFHLLVANVLWIAFIGFLVRAGSEPA